MGSSSRGVVDVGAFRLLMWVHLHDMDEKDVLLRDILEKSVDSDDTKGMSQCT